MCAVIVGAYTEEVIQTPTTPQDWIVIANHNSQRWQYHHCLWAIDGKHVAIRKPMNAGSYYCNYKNFHLVVLMALADGDYKFTWLEVGANGPSSDAQIFEDCGQKQAIDQHVIGFLPPDHLPYGILCLEVPERIYNYRTSHCRRVCENAFSILANRYASLLSFIKFQPKIATDIVLAAICCHNLMRMRYPAIQNAAMDRKDDNNNVIPGEWRRWNTWEQEL